MRARVVTIVSRLVDWFRSSSLDQEFDTEIQDHLARLTDEYIERGLTPADATRLARVRLGGVTQLKEEQREQRGVPVLDHLWQDARYAVRVFRRNPGFTLVGILTIALGVGVNTIVFTLLNAVAFKQLPVANADTLVRVERWFQSGARGDVQYAFSFEEYSHIRKNSQRLASLIAVSWPESVPSSVDGAQTVQGQLVSGDYFAVLGVTAALGRTFVPEEDQVPGRNPVAVLADGFWRHHLQSDPHAIGRSIVLSGTAFTIIGVAPATFIGTGNPPRVPDFWAPLMMQGVLTPGAAWLERADRHRLQLLARVKPECPLEEARAEMQVLTLQLVEHPETNFAGDRTMALKLQPAVFFGGTDDVRFAAIAALAMTIASMILLVACANLANMLLARGVARQREIGMRLALGASRSRVVRQLLTENVLLATIGGMSGLLLSYWGGALAWNVVDRVVQLIFLSDRPFVASVSPDARVLAFAIGVSLTTGLLFGLSPALKSSRPDLVTSLKGEASAMSDRLRPTRSWLIAGQMAVSIAFLICGGLLLKGLTYAQRADPGFESARVFMAFMSLGSNPETAPGLQQRILDRLRQSAAIQQMALVDRYPFGGTWTPPMMVNDPGSPSGHRSARTLANYVSPSYFATMGIPIERGRTFSNQDGVGNPVAIVSESAARFFWPQDDPIGRRLTLDINFKGQLADFEVIGIAKDVRSANLSRIDPAYVYLPIRSGQPYNLLLRSNADIRDVSAAVTDAIEATDRRLLPSAHVAKLDDAPFVRLQLALPGIIAPCVAALALVALLLAGIGLYGVTSYTAAQRRGEVGIRMALGATPATVRWLMIRQALRPVMIGAAIGLAAAGGLSHLLQSTLTMPGAPDFLFGVGAFDPMTFAGVTVFAFFVAITASYLPLRHATQVDPIAALRCK